MGRFGAAGSAFLPFQAWNRQGRGAVSPPPLHAPFRKTIRAPGSPTRVVRVRSPAAHARSRLVAQRREGQTSTVRAHVPRGPK
eukprot:354837-Chlamydomonas_euryale.AAC.10